MRSVIEFRCTAVNCPMHSEGEACGCALGQEIVLDEDGQCTFRKKGGSTDE